MDDEVKITDKLKKLVKQRNTPVIVDEREKGYKTSRSKSSSSSESYFYSGSDE